MSERKVVANVSSPLFEAPGAKRLNLRTTTIKAHLTTDLGIQIFGWTPLKGGDPAAPSGTATLLRLRPSHQSHPRHLLPNKRLAQRLQALPASMT